MKILGVDTVARSCSVAIVEEAAILSEVTKVSSHTHAIHLMEMIDQALKLSRFRLNDIDGFAVTEGPGSFTGLRIGISTVKGLASATGKPAVGVSSLRVLANQLVPCSVLICPLLDARKNEVYSCLFRCAGHDLIQESEPCVLPPDKAVSDICEPCIFVGDGAHLYKDTIDRAVGELASFAPPSYNILRASTVAAVGIEKLKENKKYNAASLIPYYIRRSDAEKSSGKNPTV